MNWQPVDSLRLSAHCISHYLQVIVHIFKIRELQTQFWRPTSTWHIRRPVQHWAYSAPSEELPLVQLHPAQRAALTYALCMAPQACEFANPNLAQVLHFEQKVSLPEATHQERDSGGRRVRVWSFSVSWHTLPLQRTPPPLSTSSTNCVQFLKQTTLTFSTFPFIHSFFCMFDFLIDDNSVSVISFIDDLQDHHAKKQQISNRTKLKHQLLHSSADTGPERIPGIKWQPNN